MRRAEWQVRAVDPKTPLGWWLRGIVEEDRLFGFQLLTLSAGMLSSAMGFQGGVAVMVFGSLLAALARRRRRPDRLASLLPEPPPPHQSRASVAYRRSGKAVGSDEMAVTVVDGWLYAEGVRSHFAVRPEDVRQFRTYSDRTAHLALAEGTEVRLSRLPDTARVDLERWRRQEYRTAGEPIFPPANVHPQNFARWWSYVVAGAALALLARFVTWAPTDSLRAELVRNGGWYSGLAIALFGVHNLVDLKARDWSARREIVAEQSPRLPDGPSLLQEELTGEDGVRVRT